LASRSVNKATLIGSLGKDAEIVFTPSGIAKTTFSVATSYRFKKGEEWTEETTWHNIVLWRSENLTNYLQKGTKVYVEGRIANRKYEKDGQTRYISEIVAEQVILLDGKQSDEAPASRPRGGSAGAGPQKISESLGIDESDVPF
jgi:single-strand DNA-binding protein